MASAGILDAIVLPGTSDKLIATIVPDEHATDRILDGLKGADIDFIGKNIGSLVLLPVARVGRWALGVGPWGAGHMPGPVSPVRPFG